MKIGIILGSARPGGNSKGLVVWLLSLISHYSIIINNNSTSSCVDEFNNESPTSTSTNTSFEYIYLYPDAPVHPLGPVMDDIIAAMIPKTAGNNVSNTYQYNDINIQQWSNLVSSCDGYIILTPQYNWGYPGDMKNAMDHLYKEWHNKPAMIVTYGGHGGNKCGMQLRQVLHGFKMKLVEEEVSITLPEDYIRGSARMKPCDFHNTNYKSKFESKTVSCNTEVDEAGEVEVKHMHGFLKEYELSIQNATTAFMKLLS